MPRAVAPETRMIPVGGSGIELRKPSKVGWPRQPVTAEYTTAAPSDPRLLHVTWVTDTQDNAIRTTKYTWITFLPKVRCDAAPPQQAAIWWPTRRNERETENDALPVLLSSEWPPQGLYEQFRRVANFYFLLIAILSCTPVRCVRIAVHDEYTCNRALNPCNKFSDVSACSPVNPYTNVFPLVIVLAVSLFKEALEDRKRHVKDVEVQTVDTLPLQRCRSPLLCHMCVS